MLDDDASNALAGDALVGADGRSGRADRSGERVREGPVSVELTTAQVERVVRATAEARGPSLSLLLSGLIAEQAISESSLEERYWAELESGRLSHSLFRGLLILALFISGEEGRGVVEVARQLGLSPSTTHRYISTLVAFGLLVQDPATRKYRLPL
jgi:IclR helix-turn-helix domain